VRVNPIDIVCGGIYMCVCKHARMYRYILYIIVCGVYIHVCKRASMYMNMYIYIYIIVCGVRTGCGHARVNPI